jgi:hypothetical protein
MEYTLMAALQKFEPIEYDGSAHKRMIAVCKRVRSVAASYKCQHAFIET